MATEPANSFPLYAALITGGFSFLGALLATVGGKYWERRAESKQLARAFKGELAAIVYILEFRNYQSGLRRYAEECISQQKVLVFSVGVRQEYAAVYKANVAKIGSLPGTLGEQVAIIYTLASSLLEDFQSSAEIAAEVRNITLMGTYLQTAARYRAVANHIDEIIARCKIAIVEINGLYPDTKRRWWEICCTKKARQS